MQVENIKALLQQNYSDENLAALLAHAESGKLGWNSCCCFVGIPTAPHPLQAATPVGEMRNSCEGDSHLEDARRLPFAAEAEQEFLHLGWSDKLRCEIIAGLVRDEIQVREFKRYLSESADTTWPSGTEIHNRFCGRDGEPCQACLLRAESVEAEPAEEQVRA